VDSTTYFNERAISTQQTGFRKPCHSVAQMAARIQVGGVLWFG
jgi:hypothetical protein